MELAEAFKILGIDENSSLNDLNFSFRKLAKRYHPDFNKDREKWANKRMTELNLAYETALQYLTSPDKYTEKLHPEKDKWDFNRYFHRAKDFVMEGIFIYYKYGLDNIHLRNEGVRRIRYSDSIRYMEKGIKLLNKIFTSMVEPEYLEWSKSLLDFSTAFLKNMKSFRVFKISGNSYEDNAYRHYREGSKLLDDVVKQVFFGDIMPLYTRESFYSKISRSYEEFMLVLSKYSKSSWVGDTVFKIYLIELLTRVIKVFKRMVY